MAIDAGSTVAISSELGAPDQRVGRYRLGARHGEQRLARAHLTRAPARAAPAVTRCRAPPPPARTSRSSGRPYRRACSAKASSAAGEVAPTGTRFAPDQQAAQSSPASNQPQISPPRRTGSLPTRCDTLGDHDVRHRVGRAQRQHGITVASLERPQRRAGGAQHGLSLPPPRLRCRDDTTKCAQLTLTDGCADVDALVLHGLGDPHGLLDERLDDLRLGHGLDHLALDEDLALAVAGGDAEVGLARLARVR